MKILNKLKYLSINEKLQKKLYNVFNFERFFQLGNKKFCGILVFLAVFELGQILCGKKPNKVLKLQAAIEPTVFI